MALRLVRRRHAPTQPPRRWRRIALALLSLPAVALVASSALAKPRHNKETVTPRGAARHTSSTRGLGKEAATRQLQARADAVRTRLGIERAVAVQLVEKNPYVVSVEAPQQAEGPFVVQVEEQMLELLSADELDAVLAHELGHVWIFTHHPYLQTELLANQVAMRAVGRDALARVYEKVWKDGPKGDLVAFLGNVDPQ